MESIAIAKPDTGVLSRERLLLSPFGALAQAFAEELLARAEPEEGRWPFVPLELLEEGPESPGSPAAPPSMTFQVDLRLVLEALRREGNRTEQRQVTERIVERILQLQSQREQRPKRNAPAQIRPQSPVILGTVQQTFQQHLTQNIRITAPLSPASVSQGQHTPGALAQQAGLFSQQLQVLREEGKSLSKQSSLARDRIVRLPSQEDTLHPTPQAGSPEESFRSLPREALALLEAQGQEAARTVSGAQSAGLLRTAARLEALVEDALGERAKNPPGKPLSVSKPAQGPRRDIRVTPMDLSSEESSKPLPSVGAHNTPAISPLDLSLQTEQAESGTVPTSPSVPHTGRPSSQRARPTQPGPSVQSAGKTGRELSKGTQAPAHHMHPKHSLTTAGPAQPTPAAALPTAWDIRITPEIHPPNKSGAIPRSPQETQEWTALSQPPPELALRAEPEEVKAADTSGAPHAGKNTSQAAPGRQSGTSDQPVKAPAAHRSSGERSESPRQVSSQNGSLNPSAHSARGPVMGPISEEPPSLEKAPAGSNALQRAVSSQPTAAEGPARRAAPADQAVSAGNTASPAPPITARDIRMNPALHSGSQPAETGQETRESLTLSQLPLELALRAEPEEAPTASGTSGIPSTEKSAQSAGTSVEHPLSPSELHAKTGPSVRKTFRKASPAYPASAEGTSHTEARLLRAMPTADRPARILPITARDIRVKASAPHGNTAVPDRQAQGVSAYSGQFPEETLSHGEGQPGVKSAAWALPSAELALNQQDGPADGLSPESFQPSLSEDSSLREATGRAAPTEPVTLTYGPTQTAAGPSAPSPTEGSAQSQIPESDYIRSLPDWARRFLKPGGADSQVPRSMGVARDIASLPQPETGDTVEWTAPGYHPPQAPITYREKSREEQPREVREVRITDAEIQRTADQVYRIIEDRIRRERRRLGL